MQIENRTPARRCKKTAIRRIRSVGNQPVVNLTVNRNHTFITACGVAVHNCDKMSPLAQGFLRNEMETYSDVCRFVLTCAEEGTLVYTPSGYKPIESIGVGDSVLSGTGEALTVRQLVNSNAKQLLRISTRHGNHIAVTPNHRFMTSSGWKRADEFKVGQRLSISLGDTFGTQHHVPVSDQQFLDRADFVLFLKRQHLLDRAAITAAKHEDFVSPSGLAAIEAKLEILPPRVTVGSFAEHLSTTKTVSRQLLQKLLTTGEVTREAISGEIVYSANWLAVLDVVKRKFSAFVEKFGLDQSMTYSKFYYRFTRAHTMYSIEDVVEKLEPIFAHAADLHVELGRLVGFLYGDGSLSRKGCHFAANNNECLRRAAADISKIRPDIKKFDITSNGRESEGLKISFGDRALALLFAYIGVPVGDKVEQVYKLPSAFYKSKTFARAFMQALFDCDGNSPRLCGRMDRKNHWTVAPIILRQHTVDKALSFWKELAAGAKQHFDFCSTVCASDEFIKSETLGNPTQYTCPRSVATLAICTQSDVMKFYETIGSHYEVLKIRPDILGYLKYKQHISATNEFLSFEQWADAFDYEDGVIQDKITEIRSEEGEFNVYDCSFDTIHSYVTEGFISHNCNYPQKIIPALHSRVQELKFPSLDREEYTYRLADVLVAEKVEFEPELLLEYVAATYPDLRKCINLAQQNTRNGKLSAIRRDEGDTKDYLLAVVDLFRKGKFIEGRQLVLSQIQAEEYEDFYRVLYQNLSLFGSTQDQQDEILLIIRKALVHHSTVADSEINLAACLAEITLAQKLRK